MDDRKFIHIYTTFPDIETAECLGHGLVEKSLCACINIFPQVTSIYKWQGKVESANEVVAIFKTSESLYEEVEKEISSHHPYQTPCILKINIDTGKKEYLDWIEENIKKP